VGVADNAIKSNASVPATNIEKDGEELQSFGSGYQLCFWYDGEFFRS